MWVNIIDKGEDEKLVLFASALDLISSDTNWGIELVNFFVKARFKEVLLFDFPYDSSILNWFLNIHSHENLSWDLKSLNINIKGLSSDEISKPKVWLEKYKTIVKYLLDFEENEEDYKNVLAILHSFNEYIPLEKLFTPSSRNRNILEGGEWLPENIILFPSPSGSSTKRQPNWEQWSWTIIKFPA